MKKILYICIGILEELNYLDLSDNQLTSNPGSICNLNWNSYINVTGNYLCEEHEYKCIDA